MSMAVCCIGTATTPLLFPMEFPTDAPTLANRQNACMDCELRHRERGLSLPRCSTNRARRLVPRKMKRANIGANSGYFRHSSLVTGLRQRGLDRRFGSGQPRRLPAFQADHAGSIPVGRSRQFSPSVRSSQHFDRHSERARDGSGLRLRSNCAIAFQLCTLATRRIVLHV